MSGTNLQGSIPFPVIEKPGEEKHDLHAEQPHPDQKRQVQKLLLKQDLHIIPFSVWLYLLCYLDRSNIGNAKVLNRESHNDLLHSLKMSEHQYKVAVMMFFVAYVSFEIPASWGLKCLGPRRWIALLCGFWGALTMLLGAVDSFSGLATLRFFLGALESGLFPGIVTLLTFWYRPEERSLRIALILASATLAGAFGGALGTGISYMNGICGFEAWRWMFILEGLPCLVTAPLVWFCFPDWPESASFLNTEERLLSKQRQQQHSQGSDRICKEDIKSSLTELRPYVHYITNIGIAAPISSLSLFAPTVVSGLGYSSGVEANLYTIPPFAIAWVVTCTVAYLADRHNKRGVACTISSAIACAAYGAFGFLTEDRFKVRYGLLILATSSTFAIVPPQLGWLSSNTRNPTAALLQIPLNIGIGNIGSILGVWVYKTEEKPRYITGSLVNFALLLMTSCLCCLLTLWYRTKNNKIKATGNINNLWSG